jgi:hypothetical protein
MHIVYFPLFLITEYFIGECDLLKLLFSPLGIICILVWMIFNGHLFESLFDLFFLCIPWYPEDLVVIFGLLLRLIPHVLFILLSLSVTSWIMMASSTFESKLLSFYEDG